MKKHFLPSLLILFAMLLLSGNSVSAGSYFARNLSIFLGGKIHIRFDHLLLGWTKSQQFVDRIRYELTCLSGDAVLTNVDYLDEALYESPTMRWQQSDKEFYWDFSARANRLDGKHRISIKRTCNVQIKPYTLDTARVRFHISAMGRKYLVVWAPKTNRIYTTWIKN